MKFVDFKSLIVKNKSSVCMITREQAESLERGDICYVHRSPELGREDDIFIYTGDFLSPSDIDTVNYLGHVCNFSVGDGKQKPPIIIPFDQDPIYSGLKKDDPIDDLARRLGRFPVVGNEFSSLGHIPAWGDDSELYVNDGIREFLLKERPPNICTALVAYNFLKELLAEPVPLSSDE